MEQQTLSIEHFVFESREVYDRAKLELDFIQKIRENVDLGIGENALKVYNKAVSGKMFETAIGHTFLYELRRTIEEGGAAAADALEDIPVKGAERPQSDVIPRKPEGEGRFRRLYEEQRLSNKKMKIALVAMAALLAVFIFINFQFEYSIFTYFTDYKSNMEEELINKYESWQSDLEAREQKLEEGGKSNGG